jgi:hypothetical protein
MTIKEKYKMQNLKKTIISPTTNNHEKMVKCDDNQLRKAQLHLFNHGHLSQNQNNKYNITIHTQTIYSLEISLIIYIEYTGQYKYHTYSEKNPKTTQPNLLP